MRVRERVEFCPVHPTESLIREGQDLYEANGERWVVYLDRCPMRGCKHVRRSPPKRPTAKQLEHWDFLRMREGNAMIPNISEEAGLRPPAPPDDTELSAPALTRRDQVLRELLRWGYSEAQIEAHLAELAKLPD